MISTSMPAAGLTHHDLNVSATTSEDEDMSEEGGRLIINMPVEGQIPENMLPTQETSPSSLPADLPHTPNFSSSALTPATSTTPLSSLPPVSATAATTTPTPTSTQAGKRTASEAGFTATSTPSVLPTEVILEEGEEDELTESDTPTATPPPEDVEGEGPVAVAAAAMMPPLKKKRKDVSPDKYFEINDLKAGQILTTYGCAKCGKIYKWKKTLNKHWKEKHGNDPGDSQYTPPGMQILLQHTDYRQVEHRSCLHKDLLDAITVKSSDASSRSHSPHTFLNGHYSGTGQNDDVDGEEPLSFVASSIPVGPFVLGTSSQPVFPSTSGQRQSLINSLNAPISSASILKLTTTTHNTLDEMDKPLDLTIPKTH